MGLIGTSTTSSDGGSANKKKNMWESLQDFAASKPVWGTCAGMILLAEKCIGTSAVIENGQSLIGGVDITVCRNYFGSQISSFEMETPAPPGIGDTCQSFPGVFIRAPAILQAGPDVEVLGRVLATPCRQAAVTLQELERKIAAGEDVVKMHVVDALERNGHLQYKVVMQKTDGEEKKDTTAIEENHNVIILPGAALGTNAREVISAAKKRNLLCTAFHPELTEDLRWHQYFLQMVREANGTSSKQNNDMVV
jgi:5'-phosphate synthase pdxT subunit